MVVRRETDLAEVEAASTHKYLLKRPRTHGQEPASGVITLSTSEEEEAHFDNPALEKRTRQSSSVPLSSDTDLQTLISVTGRFELLIDLIWVGIIGNLAENFAREAFEQESEKNVGNALWHFAILFLMAWRFWKYLQEFMSKYATNDVIERAFVVWALILAMLWGNNAPYLFNTESQSNDAINIYLVWRGSVFLVEIYYSLFIHNIRRRISFQGCFIIPVLPLWIAADYCDIRIKAGLAFVAINLEFYATFVLDTPLLHRFLHELDQGERMNLEHWTERIQDFYIIILGEGVLSLIRGSPLKRGLSLRTSAGVVSLLIYYALSSFYFNGDQSRRYIHAVRRTYWRKSLWEFFHSALFGCTLIIGVSIVFLVENLGTNAIVPDTEDEKAIALAKAIYFAKWTISGALALILWNQTLIALLSRSLDNPGSLKINNRYLRLLPRVLLIPIIVCLPLVREMYPLTYLGTVSGLLMACVPWEWWASLERGGGFLER